MENLNELNVQILNTDELTETIGGKGPSGWWGILIWAADEIYDGLTRPCECEDGE
jgi:hypothetical protein